MSMVNTEGLTLIGAGSEWFWSMLQFMVVAITLVGIYLQLRQSRAANAFAQAGVIDEQWHGEQLLRRRLAIAVVLRDGGSDADLSALYVPIASFWENVGALVRARHIELAVVRDNLGGACRAWWGILEPDVRRVQAVEGSDVWEHFEWLAAELARSDLAHDVPDDAFAREAAVANTVRTIGALRASVADLEVMRTVTLAPAQVVEPNTVATASGSRVVEEPSPGTAA